MYIKELIWLALKSKIESYFHQFLLIGLLEENPKCKSLVFIQLLLLQ